jgi:dihydroneopterin aldolase
MEKWIQMDGLLLNLSIGIHDFEMQAPQPLRLDIGLALKHYYRTQRDSIEESINFDVLRERVSSHLRSKHFNLQETVIQDVIHICFDLDPRVTAVDVRTSKTSAYPDCQSVGLHYQVSRHELRTM